MFVFEREIESADVVAEYDHVHHAKIVSLLEEGRLKLLESIGHSQDSLVQRGIFLVITDLKVKFLREIRSGLVKITCEQTKIEDKTISIEQRIISAERGKDLVKAEIVLMIIDKNVGKSILIPEFLRLSLKQALNLSCL